MPRNATQCHATLATPSTQRNTLTALRRLWKTRSQRATRSHRDTTEPETSHRDRGKAQGRDRVPSRRRSSRSRSLRGRSPPRRFRRENPTSESRPLSACQICLGRHQHRIQECQAITLWDGQNKARCTRDTNGKIIDNQGRELCTDWNQARGCRDSSLRHIHECSGCGNKSHGAQECHLAEAPKTSHSSRR